MTIDRATIELPITVYQELQAVAAAEQISAVTLIRRWLRRERALDQQPPKPTPKRLSILTILANAPGQRIFQSASEVNRYLREERDGWDN